MKLRVIRPASLELAAAVDYYEEVQAGLGERFWREVDDRLRWIRSNSSVPRLRSGAYRQVNLDVLPYYIAYSVRGDEIVVWAIGCAHRKPEYWKSRIPKK